MVPTYNPPPGATHVIVWVPPEIAPDYQDGIWDLMSVTVFLDNHPDEDEVQSTVAEPADSLTGLAEWAAGLLGFPVSLTQEPGEWIGVPYGPFRPPFKGGNTVTAAINRCWPIRRIPRGVYWIIPAVAPAIT